MPDNELEMAVAEAELGIEVEKFIETPLGRYLEGCREQDEQDAMDKLLEFDPYQFATLGELQANIAKIQEKVLIARKVHGYLSDAIIRGNQAEEIIANSGDD